MKARPTTEVMIASNLSDLHGRLNRLMELLSLNHAVVEPTERERERFTRVLEAMAMVRAANALTMVRINKRS
jgi:hypothetical protein